MLSHQSNLSLPKVPELDRAATSACAMNKKGLKPREHVQCSAFPHEAGRNKGFYCEKC